MNATTENKNIKKIAYIIFWVLLIAGLATRTYQHFMGRSLWDDECHFALNFIKYNYIELTRPLDDIQAGPILFLWGVKTFNHIFGYTEVAFRMLTWVICIAVLPLFYFFVWELTRQRITALLAFLMFCINITVIYFSSELKPYGIDMSMYILMGYLVISTNDFVSRNRKLLLGIAGCFALLISNTAFIALFCAGAYILLDFFKTRRIEPRYLIVFGIWAAVFLLNYNKFIHNHPATEIQRINYSFGFVPHDVFTPEFKNYFMARYDEIFHSMLLHIWKLPYIWAFVLFLLFIATRTAVKRKDHKLLIFTWLPVLSFLGLAILHVYPFWFRLILTVVPCFMILLAYATYTISSFLTKKTHLAVGGIFFLFCMVIFTKEDIAGYPQTHNNIKPALTYMNEHVPTDLKIYITTPINPYKYYRYRGIVVDTNYEAIPWDISPEEFYYITSGETKNYVFLYHNPYAPGHYEDVVEDVRNKGLLVQEFTEDGYGVDVLKPSEKLDVYKTIEGEALADNVTDEMPMWEGSINVKDIELEAGKYDIYVVSKGTHSEWVFPQSSVFVNENKIGEFTSTRYLSRSNAMAYTQVGNGIIRIRLNLDNDLSNETGDRNVFIKKIIIARSTE